MTSIEQIARWSLSDAAEFRDPLALRQAPASKDRVELHIEGVVPDAAWAIEDTDRQVLASSASSRSLLGGLEVRADGPSLRISVPAAAERRLVLRSGGQA